MKRLYATLLFGIAVALSLLAAPEDKNLIRKTYRIRLEEWRTLVKMVAKDIDPYDREDASKALKAGGITFSSPAAAVYIASSEELVVRNTPPEMRKLDILIWKMREKEKGKGGR
jgi:hypothetical protein